LTAWLAANPPRGGTLWDVQCESFEHREKYSMGSGYYLQAGRSGWRVSKKHCGPDRWIDADLSRVS
jgi:hypothetical protein